MAACRTPRDLVIGGAPPEHYFNLFPGRNLERDFAGNSDLTVGLDFSTKV